MVDRRCGKTTSVKILYNSIFGNFKGSTFFSIVLKVLELSKTGIWFVCKKNCDLLNPVLTHQLKSCTCRVPFSSLYQDHRMKSSTPLAASRSHLSETQQLKKIMWRKISFSSLFNHHSLFYSQSLW
ncbi:hypothetical protein EUGRSUZ_F02386 [Eucalyptus grandis]|uniref:Uncharacterized protein n=2 Tax=Eucalyptus grandis TaxID=71139 RepID=A0ACC3KHH2_EUCGR|nr:hypothetical protein EUGRSUZ_F02386 [Eucalyptus grandis]